MTANHILATSLATFLSLTTALAVTETWDGGGAGSNISTGANWVDNTAPVSSLINTDLIFAGNVNTSPNFPVPFSAHSITFNSTAAQFHLFGEPLTVGSGGIRNQDTELQKFNNLVQIGVPAVSFSASDGPLEFGQVSLGTNALTVTGPSTTMFGKILGTGSVTQSGTGTMTLPQVDLPFDLTVAAGVVKLTASTAMVNSGGSIAVDNGRLNVEGDLRLQTNSTLSRSAFGDLVFAAQSTINVGSNSTIAITGDFRQDTAIFLNLDLPGASFTTTGEFSANSSSVITIARGGSLTSSTLSFGGGAQVLVDGPGSSMNATGIADFGAAAGDARIIYTNHSTGTFGGLSIGNGFSGATFTVQNGADIQAADLFVGIGVQQGLVTVSGPGSSLTLGTGTVMLGGDSLGSGSISVFDAATFTSGPGPFFLRKTGYLNINGGTVLLNAPIIQQGGSVNFQSGLLSMPGNVEISAAGLFGADWAVAGHVFASGRQLIQLDLRIGQMRQ